MTGAAGDSPDTAGTDPLVTAVSEAIAVHSLERGHRGMFSICSCGQRFPLTERTAFNAHQAQAVVAAVRAHQNTTGQQTAAQALRDAAIVDRIRILREVKAEEHWLCVEDLDRALDMATPPGETGHGAP